MVFLRDEGSEFDAPLERVWALFGSKENHRHASMQGLRATPADGPNAHFLEWTAVARGVAVPIKARITLYPPLGFVMEYLEGPLTGSREFEYYVPHGERTGIVVVGEYRSSVLSEELLRSVMEEALGAAFEEDQENLARTRS